MKATKSITQKSGRYCVEFSVFVLAVSLASSALPAAEFRVTNTLDTGLGSLRWAISNANAIVGSHRIICTNVFGTITLSSPLPELVGSIAIGGPGASLLTIHGSNKFRVFQVAPNNGVSISGVTITGGFVTNRGGAGILNAGSLTLAGCVVVGNGTLSAPGGGILSQGSLTLLNSTIASNTARGFSGSFLGRDFRGLGGGAYFDGGIGFVSNCLFVANQAIGGTSFDISPSGEALGGAAFVQSGTLTFANTTLFANRANGGAGGGDYFVGRGGANAYGGAISLPSNALANLLLVNCTLSGNRAAGGGGGGGVHYGGDGGNAYGGSVFAGAASISLVNCTVYENVAVGGPGGPGGTMFPYRSGSSGYGSGSGFYSSAGAVSMLNTLLQSSYGGFNSRGHNLVQSGFGMTGLVASDQTNTSFSLGALDDYGGGTLTHAPLLNSPAIDAGTSHGAPTNDQRGVPRPQSFFVDVGAVELIASGPPVILSVSSNQSVVAGTNEIRFGCTVFGVQPITVQWYHNGYLVPGATTTNLVLNDVSTNDTGEYLVVAMNSSGSVTSAPVVLMVVPVPPYITRQPQSQYVPLNARALFCAAVVGSQPLRYQWRWDGIDIPGAHDASLLFPITSLTNVGDYSVVVANDFGSVTSQVASLVLFATSPALSIVAWGDSRQAALPNGLSNVADVVAGGLTSAARKNDGTIVVWGSTLSNSPPSLTNIAAVSVSDSHVIALRSNGTVVAWGDNSYGQTNIPIGLTDVIAVAAGQCHSMALKGNGQVVIWGGCGNDESRVPQNLGRVVAIAAGYFHCLALNENGMVAAWGLGYFGQTNVPPGLSNVIGIAASPYQSLALRSDGRVFAWGKSLETVKPLVGDCSFQAARVGGDFCLGLLNDRTVVAWGTNYRDRGQLNVPPGLVGVTKIAAGSFHSLALGIQLPTLASPVVTALSEDQIGVMGRSLTLGISAYGASPISYQWLKDGEPIRRGTNATLQIHNVANWTEGQFSVVLSNAFGVITGGVVNVIVHSPLIVNVSGGGVVGVFPDAGAYPSNTPVSLVATSAPGWVFLQWLGDVTGTNASASVLVDSTRCAQALFGTTLNTTVVGGGSVVVEPAQALYPYGTVVRLTAVPQDGNSFGAWGNAAMSTNNPLLFPVTNANLTVSCVFGSLSAGQVALTVLVNGRGRVATSPRGNRFLNGQSVTLTATADVDQTFLGWTGDATGTTTNLTVALTQSEFITANFTQRSRLSLGPCLGGWQEEGFQLTLTGEMGGRYRIEQSSGLADWSLLSTLTNTYGVWQMIDTSATNGATRFYRAVEEP